MTDFFDRSANQRRSRSGPFADQQTASRKRRKKQRRRSFVILVMAIAFLSSVSVIFIPEFFKESKVVEDYPGPGSGKVSIVIPESATGREIAAILKEKGVIANAQPFIDAYNNDKRAQSQIKPGVYELKKRMSSAGALASLLGRQSTEVRVTIPEGWTKQQIYERLADNLNVPVTDVQKAAENTAAIGLPSEADGNPEGWYAPLTYSFPKDTKPEDALKKMVESRIAQLKKLKIPSGQWQNVLIKASIVEREVNKGEYYPKVARVIENRLTDKGQVNGLLQMDSTVLYGLGHRGGSPTAAQTRDASNKYNTYQHPGLPPTPISAAGDAAIDGVLHPADGNWLYFVTVNLETGETKFTADWDEHLKNVDELKKWNKAHPHPSATSGDAAGGQKDTTGGQKSDKESDRQTGGSTGK